MATIRRREGRPSPWEAVHRDPSGRQRTRAFRRKVDAQRWLDEQTAAIVTGQYVAPDAGAVTFREYAEAWRAAQVHRPSTAEKVESTLRHHAYPTFGDQPLRSILPTHIQAWVKALSARLSPSTIAVTHGIVASVFKAAVRDRRIVSTPCEGTKLPRVVREPVMPLDLDQVRALEAAMPAHYRAMVTLGAATGLRLSEMLGLTLDRTGLWPPTDRPILTVDRQLISLSGCDPYLGPPKRRASRRDIPLPHSAAVALREHLVAFPVVEQVVDVRDHANRLTTESVGLVFTTRTGMPVRRGTFYDSWKPSARRAGVDATPHDLRHFYASLLIRHGESVKVVQARLGHATAAETLDTYSHLWPDAEDRTRAAIDAVLNPPEQVDDVAR